MIKTKFIVITAARNEGNFLSQTIDSLLSQTWLPQAWVIVDDGSRDETASIALEAARENPWIQIVRRPDRGYRDVGRGQVEALNEGLRHLKTTGYDFLFNLDADIWLGPRYFEGILRKFADNPRLGIGVGQLYEVRRGKLVKMRALPLGAAGAVQGWRRQCFEVTGGLVPGPGWDGLAVFQARRRGWDTQTFADEELKVIQLRPGGASIQNRYRGWARHGYALYFAGSHPVWVLASALYHGLAPPYVLAGACLLLGYLEAILKGAPRYQNVEFHRYLREWQLRKLAELLRLA
jgi:biofilm PGA synthesis N-glycosyltransferase PgaC